MGPQPTYTTGRRVQCSKVLRVPHLQWPKERPSAFPWSHIPACDRGHFQGWKTPASTPTARHPCAWDRERPLWEEPCLCSPEPEHAETIHSRGPLRREGALVLISCGCHNKWPCTRWLKTVEPFLSQFWGPEVLKLRCQKGWFFMETPRNTLSPMPLS